MNHHSVDVDYLTPVLWDCYFPHRLVSCYEREECLLISVSVSVSFLLSLYTRYNEIAKPLHKQFRCILCTMTIKMKLKLKLKSTDIPLFLILAVYSIINNLPCFPQCCDVSSKREHIWHSSSVSCSELKWHIHSLTTLLGTPC